MHAHELSQKWMQTIKINAGYRGKTKVVQTKAEHVANSELIEMRSKIEVFQLWRI